MKTFVINLPFKTDRLSAFRERYPKCLPPFDVWEAVHGDSIRHPDSWTSGAGAFGCYRSHMQLLEHCYQKQIESYLVFEDDAIFHQDFCDLYAKFMEELPDDWEMAYIGGQLLHEFEHPPRKVSENVFVPWNVNRTHCFMVHRRGYEKVYKHLWNLPFPNGWHIDHYLGLLHESGTLNLYCPGKWMVGQDAGPSNISGKHNAAEFWVDPEKLADTNRTWQPRTVPTVFLESSIETAIELERRGWHRGHWQNSSHLDIGVCNAMASHDVKGELQNWHRIVMPEAIREGKKCVCLYHPSLHIACVESLDGIKCHHIQTDNAEDAEHQLAAIKSEPITAIKPPRHLIYHIWPRKGTGVWQWNVDQLLQRIDQFDGVRSISVVTDEDSDTFDDVKAAFGDVRIDNWFGFPNDPGLGETVSLKTLLDTVKRHPGYTFYGHAKAVKYPLGDVHQRWAEMMYEICLDDRSYVDAALEQLATAGPFLRERPHWQPHEKTGWHYSGTFFWFRNKDIFAHPDWDKIHKWYFGVEMWLGNFMPQDQAYCLFGNTVGDIWIPEEMARMERWLSDWKKSRPLLG